MSAAAGAKETFSDKFATAHEAARNNERKTQASSNMVAKFQSRVQNMTAEIKALTDQYKDIKNTFPDVVNQHILPRVVNRTMTSTKKSTTASGCKTGNCGSKSIPATTETAAAAPKPFGQAKSMGFEGFSRLASISASVLGNSGESSSSEASSTGAASGEEEEKAASMGDMANNFINSFGSFQSTMKTAMSGLHGFPASLRSALDGARFSHVGGHVGLASSWMKQLFPSQSLTMTSWWDALSAQQNVETSQDQFVFMDPWKPAGGKNFNVRDSAWSDAHQRLFVVGDMLDEESGRNEMVLVAMRPNGNGGTELDTSFGTGGTAAWFLDKFNVTAQSLVVYDNYVYVLGTYAATIGTQASLHHTGIAMSHAFVSCWVAQTFSLTTTASSILDADSSKSYSAGTLFPNFATAGILKISSDKYYTTAVRLIADAPKRRLIMACQALILPDTFTVPAETTADDTYVFKFDASSSSSSSSSSVGAVTTAASDLSSQMLIGVFGATGTLDTAFGQDGFLFYSPFSTTDDTLLVTDVCMYDNTLVVSAIHGIPGIGQTSDGNTVYPDNAFAKLTRWSTVLFKFSAQDGSLKNWPTEIVMDKNPLSLSVSSTVEITHKPNAGPHAELVVPTRIVWDSSKSRVLVMCMLAGLGINCLPQTHCCVVAVSDDDEKTTTIKTFGLQEHPDTWFQGQMSATSVLMCPLGLTVAFSATNVGGSYSYSYLMRWSDDDTLQNKFGQNGIVSSNVRSNLDSQSITSIALLPTDFSGLNANYPIAVSGSLELLGDKTGYVSILASKPDMRDATKSWLKSSKRPRRMKYNKNFSGLAKSKQ